MLKKKIINALRNNFALLILAALVGLIVSFVAQLFIIGAKNRCKYSQEIKCRIICSINEQLTEIYD